MIQKLLIISISLFLPKSFFESIKIAGSNVLIAVFAIISLVLHPFSDHIEDLLDIMSQVRLYNIFCYFM